MEDADVEILVLLEGVDASTSSKLQGSNDFCMILWKVYYPPVTLI